MFKKKETRELTDFINKDVTRRVNIQGETVKIEIREVKFAKSDEKEIMLDAFNVGHRIEKIIDSLQTTTTKYNPMPKKIIIYNEDIDEELENEENKQEDDIENSDLISLHKPKWNLDSVHINPGEKEAILTALVMSTYKNKLFNEWKLRGNKDFGRAVCLNFWGPPGTGKSITADAIANHLDKKLLIVNYSELESKYVGETPKNIKRIFNIAKKSDAVIVFDEADSFLGKRLTNVTQSADYGVNITRSVMLMELENFDGVIIFTTNLLNNYDEAFKRRILANIEFKLPNEMGRKAIWDSHLSESMPVGVGVSSDLLSKQFENISGADISDIILLAATRTLQGKRECVELGDFEYAYNIVKERYKNEQINNENIQIKTERISKEEYEKEVNKGALC